MFFTCVNWIFYCASVHLTFKFIVLTLFIYCIIFYQFKFHILYLVDKLESVNENITTAIACYENCHQNVASSSSFGLNTDQLKPSN